MIKSSLQGILALIINKWILTLKVGYIGGEGILEMKNIP